VQKLFSYANLVTPGITWQRWRSCHSICRSRKAMLHANFTAVCL